MSSLAIVLFFTREGNYLLFFATTIILDNVLFSDDAIITHILVLNHSNGWEAITIHMIQICDGTLIYTKVYRLCLYQLY